MDFQEFVEWASNQPQTQGIRWGQHLVNQLMHCSPVAYSRVPEDLDPFYSDTLVPGFLAFLGDNWGSLTTPLYHPEMEECA